MPTQGKSPYPFMPDIRIDKRGVQKLLKGLKAMGPDVIPARILRDFVSEFSMIITRLLQSSLNDSKIPTDWRKASIVPIYKKANSHRASNYSPVSPTFLSYKLLEHIMDSNILDHYDLCGILADQQHGFRSKRSCETQLIITIQELAIASSL
jgi:hypothetical protein